MSLSTTPVPIDVQHRIPGIQDLLSGPRQWAENNICFCVVKLGNAMFELQRRLIYKLEKQVQLVYKTVKSVPQLSRGKRNWVGDALSYLTGLATKQDVESVR